MNYDFLPYRHATSNAERLAHLERLSYTLDTYAGWGEPIPLAPFPWGLVKGRGIL
jgi:hypothetical protein